MASSSSVASAAAAAAALRRDAKERVFIITGSNTGVGLATARQIATDTQAEPRRVILACRNMEKAAAAVQAIQSAMQPGSPHRVEAMRLDLADIRSIEAFAQEFSQRKLPLHVLINNAGVNKAPMIAQPLDCEGQFVANYLGHYYLTQLLLPTLHASAPSRIINVTSYMHRLGRTDFEMQCRFASPSSYSTSKLAQIFHAHALAREWGPKGVRVFLVHPGACYSDIWNTWEPAFLRRLTPIMRRMFLTTEQGAAPSVHAATMQLQQEASSEVEHWGPYAAKAGWELLTDAWQPSSWSRVTRSDTAKVTQNPAIGEQLMGLSEQLVQEWKEAAKKQEGQ